MLRRLAKIVLALGVAGYIAAAGYMAINQRAFIFRVEPAVPVLANAGLPNAVETTFTAPDGTRLTGWHIDPSRAEVPVFVYFHGNAGNLMRRAERFRLMTAGGAGLLAFHYRGYGGSGGVPGEDELHRDAAAIYAEAERRFPGHKLIIFGESLGTGVATRLAITAPAAGLILDSPFMSVQDRAEATYAWLPVGLLINHPFRSDQAIAKVRMPLLVLHGARDMIVPISDGERLFALASEPKTFVRYADAGHVGAFRFGAMNDIQRFLKEKLGLNVQKSD